MYFSALIRSLFLYEDYEMLKKVKQKSSKKDKTMNDLEKKDNNRYFQIFKMV